MDKKVEFNTDDNDIRFIIESAMAKLEKINTRLWIAVLVLIVALIGTNAYWIYNESQYEDVVTATQTVTQESDGEGNNTFTGDFVGGDYYGETDSNKNSH